MDGLLQTSRALERVLDPLAGCRVVVVVAHPDGETIGAGAQLARFRDCFVLHVTDGAPRDLRLWPTDVLGCTRAEYARTRAREAEEALALAGIPSSRIRCLDVVDGEAVDQLAPLAFSLMQYFLALRPEVVLSQPYEGGHPDQDACAFGVHVAVELLRARTGQVPALVELSAYHGPNGQFASGDFLPARPLVATLPLSDDDLARKRQMFECFASQRSGLRSFPVGAERFRVAPRYDFTRPPHRGALYYETLGWAPNGETFRRLVREARMDLGLEEKAARL